MDREKLDEERQKLKKKIMNLRAQVTKLESNDRKLKNLLIEKESEQETERIKFKRKLNEQRKRGSFVLDKRPDSNLTVGIEV
jgi:hypothetical protein